MVSVFLSHSTKDKSFVRELTGFLERDGQIKVWLDEREIAPGGNIVGAIADGLDSDFILLILSPDSVGSNWVKEEWTDAFWGQMDSRRTKLLGVLYRDCRIPPLLRNKKYFDLRNNEPEGFREIRTFLLTQQPAAPEHVNYLPVRHPVFIGREEELSELRERLRQPGALVHVTGLPGKGKTTFALEFAHRYQKDFEAVYWLACQNPSLAAITAELASQLGLKLEGDLSVIIRELKRVCGSKHCLLILDNVQNETPGELIPGGAASVLVTTRLANLRFLRFYAPFSLPLFTEDQCLELFRRQIGVEQVARHEASCRSLFARFGYLPIAISISAALIREDVRYTVPGMTQRVPDDVTALISEAIEALDAAPRQLLAAMSACAPEGLYLDLAAEIARFGEGDALAALQQLVARSLADEVDRTDRRYRLHAIVREAGNGESCWRQHAAAVGRWFKSWEANWQRCEKELPDFQLAIERQLKSGGCPQTWELASHGYLLMRRLGRLAEALGLCKRMRRLAEEQQNEGALQGWLGRQALILEAWGELQDALALHKKQEEICLKLGNKDGLQSSYGNQALILKTWGRLEEALTLARKQEAICEELGNKGGLQASYGNQGLILQARGRLEEALALHRKQEALCIEIGDKDGLQINHENQVQILQVWGRLQESYELLKKQEAICLELGNKNGLQFCYGNQAGILRAWGRLEDALALLKKQEAICLELGNPDSLQRSYGNQALILRAVGRLEDALGLLKKQEAICLALDNKNGLQACYLNQSVVLHLRGRLEDALRLLKQQEAICLELANKDGLKACYGNQSSILKAWGRLEDALALLKKEEAICLELGDRGALAHCYWGWGQLERALGRPKAEQSRFSAALALFREIGMPRERDAVEAELTKSLSEGAS